MYIFYGGNKMDHKEALDILNRFVFEKLDYFAENENGNFNTELKDEIMNFLEEQKIVVFIDGVIRELSVSLVTKCFIGNRNT